MADKAEDTKADGADDNKPDPVMDAIAKLNARMDAWDEDKKVKADDADDGKNPPSEKVIEEEAKPDSDDGDDDKKEKAEDKKADASEDDDKDKKADSVSRADFEALRRQMPIALTDTDLNELAEIQARVDSVAQAFGERGLRPMQGEKPVQFRRRMAAKYQDHSEDWRGVDLNALPPSALGVAEKSIFAAATAKADSIEAIPVGQLRETIRTDDTGRRIKEYTGSPSSWMDEFKFPPKFVGKINTAKGA